MKNADLFAELAKYPKNSPEYRDIASEIVKNNQPLVISVAKKYFPIMGRALEKDDLISEGLLGLLDAIKSFKSEKVLFSTFATRCIKNRIFQRLERERRHRMPSLQDNKKRYKNGSQQKLEDVIASSINIEEEFLEKDEQERQMAWLREHLERLTPRQKRIITAKYLSGERVLSDCALAKQFACSHQYISPIKTKALANLKQMLYDESHPEEIALAEKEIELTREEIIEAREVLKNLIETKLAPQQKKTTLCKFYSAALKTNQQVAQEINSKEGTVGSVILAANKRLCTLYNRSQDKKHLTDEAIRSILQFRVEASEKER